ncbi:hypothetical protein [Pendulispora albinea]|uniref:Uncharacterized protein n=1 Tax=Pendulispora albinea TaxID=2741071 RepID=A0ABZ2M016_9BACT
MKKLFFLIAAALTFAIAPLTDRLGSVGGSLALVGLGVLLAWAASESVNAMAAGFGALGAFGGTVLATVSPALGAAVLVALAYVERTMRVRDPGARVIHVGGALLGGGLAGALSTAYAPAALSVRGVAIVVAAVLVLLPLLIEADDPTAHALDAASGELRGPSAEALRQGAELRRSVQDAPLDRDASRRVAQTWRSLLRLAEARTRLQRNARPIADSIPAATASTNAASADAASANSPSTTSGAASTSTTSGAASTKAAVVDMLDQRIVEHVAALTRAYTAVDTVHAATVGLDDAALRGVDTVGESLEEASQAMVEVRGAEAPVQRG